MLDATRDTKGPANEAATQPAGGFWWWFLQRASAAVLLVLVGVHIWAAHFSDLGGVIGGTVESMYTYSIVQRRLEQAFFIVIDFSLLAVALFHGLNGVRNVLAEWRPARRRLQLVTWALAVTGLAFFGYGARVLLAFILG